MKGKEKTALVLGLGISGKGAARFLLQQGKTVFAVDRKKNLSEEDQEVKELQKQGLVVKHETEIDNLDLFDELIVSPGVSRQHPLYEQAKSKQIPIIGEVELSLQNRSNRCLGITGTNGKTTVTLLVTHVLNHAGITAHAVGNVGTALSTHFHSSDDILVIELSSFQLETMQSKVFDAAVILNITPDHLDRYEDMEHYARAKIQMGHCLKKEGLFFIEEKCARQFNAILDGMSFCTYGFSSSADLYCDSTQISFQNNSIAKLPMEYKGKKNHDIENMMAAFGLCHSLGVTPEQFFSALSTFKKPSHRIEFITNVDGVDVYDDSKGTNIDAVMRAVETLGGSIYLIAGGVDKGAAYTPWIQAFGDSVKEIFAIGEAAPKMYADLIAAIPVSIHKNLETATRAAFAKAKGGDKILLSPGCSSYDMFRDYAHRGQEFQRIVRSYCINNHRGSEPNEIR